jgi:hypothetical protein
MNASLDHKCRRYSSQEASPGMMQNCLGSMISVATPVSGASWQFV